MVYVAALLDLITPQLEYTAAIWQVGDCGALEKVKGKDQLCALLFQGMQV